jgi:hypothetical protein
MSFQKIVLTVAVVLLILSLVVIGVLLYNKNSNIKFPPESSDCPDYFKATRKGVCKNVNHLAVSNPNCSTGDFSGSGYEGKHGDKRKCTWAKECGLSWDGITNSTPALC